MISGNVAPSSQGPYPPSVEIPRGVAVRVFPNGGSTSTFPLALTREDGEVIWLLDTGVTPIDPKYRHSLTGLTAAGLIAYQVAQTREEAELMRPQ